MDDSSEAKKHDRWDSRLARFAPQWDLADSLRKSLRGAEGLSVEEIARRLGVSRNTVGNWLSGRSEPSESTLMAWAQLTEVPFSWLANRKSVGNPLRGRFAHSELQSFSSKAAERGVSLSVWLRDYIQPPIAQDELELFDDATLMRMWFEDHRIFIAQREDPAPKESADHTSMYSTVMSARIENILVGRGVYPALELDRQERRMATGSTGEVFELFTIVFDQSGGSRVGGGPVATISRVNGIFPSMLVDPMDQTGAVVSGRWEYDGVDEEHRLVIYRQFLTIE